jgi:hypothetical protein
MQHWWNELTGGTAVLGERSNGGMILTGGTAVLGEKPVTVPLRTPPISHGRNVLGSNLELRGRKSAIDRLFCDN